jgi:carbon storage regulator
MLRITRRPGERIVLGEDVLIELIEIRGNTARLGIQAPRSVPVYREELWLEIKAENERAAGTQVELPEEPLSAAAEHSPATGTGN